MTNTSDKQLLEKVVEMEQHLAAGRISANSVGFVQSLCSYFRTMHYLSEKQLRYFNEHITEARMQQVAESSDSKVEKVATLVSLVNTRKFVDQINKAAETSPYIFVKLETSFIPHQQVCFYKAKDGRIIFTNGVKYGESGRKVFAVIDKTKKLVFQPDMAVTGQLMEFIESVVANLADVAAAQGFRTGNCCFCGRGIEHPNSLKHGYGPICAAKYGLPWEGEAVAETDGVAALDDGSFPS